MIARSSAICIHFKKIDKIIAADLRQSCHSLYLDLGQREHSDRLALVAVVNRYGFLHVVVQIIQASRLGKDVFPSAPRTPKLAIVVNFHLYEHRLSPPAELRFSVAIPC